MSIESIENASSWFDGPWSLLALLILATTSLIGANWIKKNIRKIRFFANSICNMACFYIIYRKLWQNNTPIPFAPAILRNA